MSETVFNIFQKSHEGSWAFVIVFFILSIIFTRQKITPMIARLFYLIMLVSGIGMLINWGFPGKYLTKGILAVLLIGVIEMIMGRTRRGRGKEPATLGMWAVFVILLILILLIGFGVI